VARVHHFYKKKLQLKDHWMNFLWECACSENFYSGTFFTTFPFKYVLNILLF
jgi:hypothetical protein